MLILSATPIHQYFQFSLSIRSWNAPSSLQILITLSKEQVGSEPAVTYSFAAFCSSLRTEELTESFFVSQFWVLHQLPKAIPLFHPFEFSTLGHWSKIFRKWRWPPWWSHQARFMYWTLSCVGCQVYHTNFRHESISTTKLQWWNLSIFQIVCRSQSLSARHLESSWSCLNWPRKSCWSGFPGRLWLLVTISCCCLSACCKVYLWSNSSANPSQYSSSCR